MDEQFSKKWTFLQRYSHALIEKAFGKMGKKTQKSLVFTGGSSLHLYSTRFIFNDPPIRASEDIDFFNRDSKLIENPGGIREPEIAKEYGAALAGLGFESEQKGSIVLILPHSIKAEFFYDSQSFPSRTYLHGVLPIIHPESLFRIKIGLLSERESVSIRDIIDVLYLSTKYHLPRRVAASEDIRPLLEWRVVGDYLTNEGEEYFKKNDYEKLAGSLAARVKVHEKD